MSVVVLYTAGGDQSRLVAVVHPGQQSDIVTVAQPRLTATRQRLLLGRTFTSVLLSAAQLRGRSGQVRSEGLKCTFRASCCSACLSQTQVPVPLSGTGKKRGEREGRKEMFYLTTHSTHFIYGYMVSEGERE